jgi:hypothetical protein
MSYILAVMSEIKINFGCQEFAAAHLQGLCLVMAEKSEGFAC